MSLSLVFTERKREREKENTLISANDHVTNDFEVVEDGRENNENKRLIKDKREQEEEEIIHFHFDQLEIRTPRQLYFIFMHFIFNRYRRYRQIRQSSIIFSLPFFFPHSKWIPPHVSDSTNVIDLSTNVTNDELFRNIFFFFVYSSLNIPIDLLMLHKDEPFIRDMNVCKHLFSPSMKKETFHYQPGNINVN